MHLKYQIMGVSNANGASLESYTHPFLIRDSYQKQFDSLSKQIQTWVSAKKGKSIIRFGDGDFNFLMRWEKGSAKPGNRGTTVPYSQVDSPKHRYGFLQNDKIAMEIQYWYRKRYLFYFVVQQPFFNRLWWRDIVYRPARALKFLTKQYSLASQCIFGPSLSLDVVYSLVASRWLFRTFPNQIGLVGNEFKLELIKTLVSHEEYQKYLGAGGFTDYVKIPQKVLLTIRKSLPRKF